jgi:Na+/H+ antiporter NhaD/arsenite permease-like protein
MFLLMVIIFVIGYALIAFENTLQINKSTFALIMCGILWTVYILTSHDPNINEVMMTQLGDTCEILVFLIGAMTIVELIDRYGGFNFITEHINAKSKKGLMWLIALVAFFMSAVLDNMTTAIIMVMMTRRLLSDQKERWMFASIIVIAANSGGAWSPIGDVTTIMLWMNDHVTSGKLILNLFIPCLASVCIPVLIASRYVKEGSLQTVTPDAITNPIMAIEHPHLSKTMLIIGVLGLIFVPVFKTLTGLPPFMGMIISLGVIWLITEVLLRHFHIDPKLGGRVSQAVRHIDMPTILFFLGILMAVSALQQAGILGTMASYMNTNIHEPFTIATLIGLLSSIVDNVPLVAACIKMFGDATAMAGVDPTYAHFFVDDGLFWHLLTFTAGVGGSILIIGSAAGVVSMGIEKIQFFWYVKRISLLALAGYIAGIVLIWLESLCPFFL